MRPPNFHRLDVRPSLDTALPVNDTVVLRIDNRFSYARWRRVAIDTTDRAEVAGIVMTQVTRQPRYHHYIWIRMLERLVNRCSQQDYLFDLIRKTPRQLARIDP